MSADILGLIADLLLRPTVVHSLPGRLTIHLPILKRVTENVVPDGIYESMASLFTGVSSFLPNYHTGNILAEYDPILTSEAVVLSSIKTVIKTLVANRSKLFGVSAHRRDDIFRKFRYYLASVEPSRMTAEEELDVPDEIWR